MDFTGLSLIKVNANTQIKSFDCGNEKLNIFLTTKAIEYHREVLATTYILENSEKTIAYFSIFNDSFSVEEKDFASSSQFKKLKARLVSHPKRHLDNFPAIKIGRLAVNSSIQKGGLGKFIISFIIDLALSHNEQCACKFITVDAKKESLKFYEKMNFTFFSEKDMNKDEREMYLNLTPLINVGATN